MSVLGLPTLGRCRKWQNRRCGARSVIFSLMATLGLRFGRQQPFPSRSPVPPRVTSRARLLPHPECPSRSSFSKGKLRPVAELMEDIFGDRSVIYIAEERHVLLT